ncbi:MAG: hypothetical protein QNJ58_26070 [Desulfobacterales bacterium]|nr:hypothetical protein [Desulfobacterales bacterium]
MVSDPDGVLRIRHSTPRTAAFRHMQSVGFLPHVRDYPYDHNYADFGAQYTAYILDPSSFRLPSPGLPVDFSTDPLAKL